MGLAALILRVVGCGVLVVAGSGKLADLRGGRRALEAFGVPSALVPTVAVVLPLTEIAVGLALLPAASAPAAATAAALLFAAFAVVIAGALRRGDAPDCHCFGAVHSAPVSGATLARALGLAAGATAVAAIEWSGSPTSAVAWLGDLSAVEAVAVGEGVALAAVVVGAVWLALHLLRQNGRVMGRLEALESAAGLVSTGSDGRSAGALEVGSRAPDFRLSGPDGVERALGDLGSPVVLIFADSGCAPCHDLLAELPASLDPVDDLAVAVVLFGDPEEAREVGGGVQLLLDPRRTTQTAYAVPGTPFAVRVERGRIAAEPAPGAVAIRRLLDGSTRAPLEVQVVG